MADYDDEDIDACSNCGTYYGWSSVKDVVDARPDLRPFPQWCRKCCDHLLEENA